MSSTQQGALQLLGRAARLAASHGGKDGALAAAKQQPGAPRRLMSSLDKPGGRYTPNIYGKEAPKDRSFGFIVNNPFIDAWAYRRDKLEKEWSWTLKNTFEFTWFVLGGFGAAYWLSLWSLNNSDRRSHYPQRAWMIEGQMNPKAWVVPDERDFY